jgi:hypothetical protein
MDVVAGAGAEADARVVVPVEPALSSARSIESLALLAPDRRESRSAERAATTLACAGSGEAPDASTPPLAGEAADSDGSAPASGGDSAAAPSNAAFPLSALVSRRDASRPRAAPLPMLSPPSEEASRIESASTEAERGAATESGDLAAGLAVGDPSEVDCAAGDDACPGRASGPGLGDAEPCNCTSLGAALGEVRAAEAAAAGSLVRSRLSSPEDAADRMESCAGETGAGAGGTAPADGNGVAAGGLEGADSGNVVACGGSASVAIASTGAEGLGAAGDDAGRASAGGPVPPGAACRGDAGAATVSGRESRL